MDAVYKALTTREGLAAWWTDNTQGESKEGGAIKFRFSAGGVEIGGFEMKVLELDAGRSVLWQVVDGHAEWIGNRISSDLKQSGDHAIVLFKHSGWKEPVEFMHHCSTKWAIHPMTLKSLVETGKDTPNPHDPHIIGDGPDSGATDEATFWTSTKFSKHWPTRVAAVCWTSYTARTVRR